MPSLLSNVIDPICQTANAAAHLSNMQRPANKSTSRSSSKESGSTRGGSHEEHVKAGEQSHKNTSGSGSKESESEGSTRGGSHEQHVKAGQQSHKNS
jgi:hypothetical protein